MTSTDVVCEFIADLFSKGDLTAVDRYLDPAFVNHDPPFPGAADGAAGMRQAAEMFRHAFPDWHSDPEHVVAEGDLVAEHFTARGTHRGPIMGVEPTGREIVLHGINLWRVVDGKIVERWGCLDNLGLMQQLGLVPGQSH
jgi:Predicted ester cyclase